MKKNREKHRDMEHHYQQQQQSFEEWSEKERQVARILLELPRVWVDRASFTWGRKKKRSAIEDTLYLSSSPQTTPSRHVGGGSATRTNGGAAVKPKTDPAAAASPASPASPLSFSRSESDDKLKSKPSLASKREQYLRMLEDLTKTKESLIQEMDNVKSHYAQLKDFNLRLKARKQQLSNSGSGSESKNSNLELEHGVNYCSNEQVQKKMNNTPHCQPSTLANQNHKCGPSKDLRGTTSFTAASSVSSSNSLGRVNAGGGPLIPDLNLTVGEFNHVGSCQPLDLTLACCEPLDKSMVNKDWSSSSRAMAAAEARERRLQICRLKMKKSIGSSSKSRFSYR